MKTPHKAIVVGVLHMIIVGSLGAKMLYDRATCPRVWVQTMQYDPELPVRGRYVALSPEIEVDDALANCGSSCYQPVRLFVKNGKLAAALDPEGTVFLAYPASGPSGIRTLTEPLLFFVSEHVQLPVRQRGAEIWVEVTLPRKGPPRPIQQATKINGEWKPFQE